MQRHSECVLPIINEYSYQYYSIAQSKDTWDSNLAAICYGITQLSQYKITHFH